MGEKDFKALLPYIRMSAGDIECKTTTNSSGSNSISFILQQQVASKDFGTPPLIPPILLEFVHMEISPEWKDFPDYSLYLEKDGCQKPFDNACGYQRWIWRLGFSICLSPPLLCSDSSELTASRLRTVLSSMPSISWFRVLVES